MQFIKHFFKFDILVLQFEMPSNNFFFRVVKNTPGIIEIVDRDGCAFRLPTF